MVSDYIVSPFMINHDENLDMNIPSNRDINHSVINHDETIDYHDIIYYRIIMVIYGFIMV